ncbi:amino acid adenylation domain-containing protein, partial [Amycolatopsis rhizosphaerae]
MTAIEGYRLSAQQRRVWHPHTAATAVTWCVVRLPDECRPAALRDALSRSVARHEILRTVFRRVQGVDVPLQIVLDGHGTLAFEVRDLRGLPVEEREERFAALREESRARTFDLEHGPTVYATMVLREEGDRLLLAVPALCADEASLGNLVRELAEPGPPCGEEPLQYADFAQWQEDLLTDAEFQVEREFWLGRPRGGGELPFAKPHDGASRPEYFGVGLPAELVTGLRELAARLDVDLPVLFLTAWHLLLRGITGRADLAIGVCHANRGAEELRGALGPYAKYPPSTASPKTHTTFADFARQVQAELRETAEVEAYFDPAASPSAIAGFSWHAFESEPPGMVLEAADAATERFPVRLAGRETGAELHVELRYDAGACESAALPVLSGQLRTLLTAAAAAPEAPARTLPLESGGEPRAAARPPAGVPVHRRFEEQARRVPGRVAVRDAERELTYARLDEQAGRLARLLREGGGGTEVRVGLCVDRSCDLVVGLLGILKSGAAYVPLDPETPSARRRLALDEAGARLVVTLSRHAADFAEPGRTTVCLDALPSGPGPEDGPAVPGGNADDRLAYVVFTSGSTGTPKGVGVSHANLASYTTSIVAALALPDGASYGFLSGVAADLGNTTLFAALCTGGTLHLLPSDYGTDPAQLRPVDCLKVVPTHLRALLSTVDAASVLPTTCLVLGGEAPDGDLVDTVHRLAPGCRVVNHYGPTETTVGVLTHEITAHRRPVPLGSPLPHSDVHLLDAELRPVPTWAEGELHVGGAGLARGYVGRPALTAERFVPDPFSDVPGARMYRTGDRAHRDTDGEFVFRGRADDQVKIRGHRVEPAEVTVVLRRHAAVRDAAVLPRQHDDGTRLVAYVVAEPGTTATALREHCARRLPDPMVPGAFVTLGELPRSANGKLDRAALAELDPARVGPETPYTEPENETEKVLADLWAQVLNLDRVGRDDDFFALGGDSILGIRVVARAAQAGLLLTPKLLFS